MSSRGRNRSTTLPVLRRRVVEDRGVTLVDLLMSMAVMAVVMAVSTTAIVQMFRLTEATEAKASAQSQVSLALVRLDKEVRYAGGIGLPYTMNGNRYVNILIIRTGLMQCVQVRLASGILQQRTWAFKSAPVQPTGWTTLASGVLPPRAATPTEAAVPEPFTFVPASDAAGYQRLWVRLTVVAGSGRSAVPRKADITFTALNTNRTTGNDLCAEGRDLT